MASKLKNSLVNNINRRKRSGKSRPKSRSTVSKASYQEMQKGWSKSGKKASGKKQASRKKQGLGKKKAASSRKSADGGKRKVAKKK